MLPPVPPPFTCTVRPNGRLVAVVVTGELDVGTVDDVDRELRVLRDESAPRVQLDLRDVTFADSTAIALLVRWSRAAGTDGWQLELTVGETIERLLSVAGVKGLLPIAGEA